MTNRSNLLTDSSGLGRRDFLKVGAGFTLAATAGTVLVGCGDAAKQPAEGYAFLRTGDVELFAALAPAVVTELAQFDGAQRQKLVGDIVRGVDATIAGMGLHSRGEVRKLLDLLAIAPLRYLLTGVGAWSEASVPDMAAFLERWRGSRFATLNAGGNALVKLTSSSFYFLPAAWALAGYPGPLDYVFKAVNA